MKNENGIKIFQYILNEDIISMNIEYILMDETILENLIAIWYTCILKLKKPMNIGLHKLSGLEYEGNYNESGYIIVYEKKHAEKLLNMYSISRKSKLQNFNGKILENVI
jgi:hypothetical protein